MYLQTMKRLQQQRINITDLEQDTHTHNTLISYISSSGIDMCVQRERERERQGANQNNFGRS